MLAGINWIAVFVAALAGYALGAIWYLPKVLGNAWMAAVGKKPEELGSPAQAMIVAAVTTLITAVCLAVILKGCTIITLSAGIVMGIVIGGGLVFASMLSDHMFQGKPMQLLWIQGGYRFVYIVLMCAIIGVWQ
jgi:hypothetical protein